MRNGSTQRPPFTRKMWSKWLQELNERNETHAVPLMEPPRPTDPVKSLMIEIVRVPPSPNYLLGKHWRFRHRNTDVWKEEVAWAVFGKAPQRPYLKARVTIERRSRGQLDPDNLVASVKPVIDALRYARVLLDDTADHLELKVTQSRGPSLTRIQIEPINV